MDDSLDKLAKWAGTTWQSMEMMKSVMPDGVIALHRLMPVSRRNEFTWVRNYSVLWKFLRARPGQEWCEKLLNWRRKIYFDIEVKQKQGSYEDGVACSEYVINYLSSSIAKFKDKDIGFYETKYPKGEGKVYSAHIVVDREVDEQRMYNIVQYLRCDHPEHKLGRFIDPGVYGSTQSFRLMTQCKEGYSTCPKLPATYGGRLAQVCDEVELEFSCVGNVTGLPVQWLPHSGPTFHDLKKFVPNVNLKGTNEATAWMVLTEKYQPVRDGALVASAYQNKLSQIYLERRANFYCCQHEKEHTYCPSAEEQRRYGKNGPGNNAYAHFLLEGPPNDWFVMVHCLSKSNETKAWHLRGEKLYSVLDDVAPELARKARELPAHLPYIDPLQIQFEVDDDRIMASDVAANSSATVSVTSSQTQSTVTSASQSPVISTVSSPLSLSTEILPPRAPLADGWNWDQKMDWDILHDKYVGKWLTAEEHEQFIIDLHASVIIVLYGKKPLVIIKRLVVDKKEYHPTDRGYTVVTLREFQRDWLASCFVPKDKKQMLKEKRKADKQRSVREKKLAETRAMLNEQAIAALDAAVAVGLLDEPEDAKGKYREEVFSAAVSINDRSFLYAGIWFYPEYPRKPVIVDQNGKRFLNTFGGYAAKMLPDEISTETLSERCRPMLNHLFEVMCDSNTDRFKWVCNWTAQLLFNTRSPIGRISLIFVGKNGDGKTKWLEFIGYRIVGHHCTTFSRTSQATGQFNATALENFILGIVPEYSGDPDKAKEDGDAMKPYVTEDRMRTEYKGVDSHEAANYMRFMSANNYVPKLCDFRRYQVDVVNSKYANNKEYFTQLDACMAKKETVDSFFTWIHRWFLKYTAHWNPIQDRVMSEIMQHITDTRPPAVMALQEFDWPYEADGSAKWVDAIDVYKHYVTWARKDNPKAKVLGYRSKGVWIPTVMQWAAGIFRYQRTTDTHKLQMCAAMDRAPNQPTAAVRQVERPLADNFSDIEAEIPIDGE